MDTTHRRGVIFRCVRRRSHSSRPRRRATSSCAAVHTVCVGRAAKDKTRRLAVFVRLATTRPNQGEVARRLRASRHDGSRGDAQRGDADGGARQRRGRPPAAARDAARRPARFDALAAADRGFRSGARAPAAAAEEPSARNDAASTLGLVEGFSLMSNAHDNVEPPSGPRGSGLQEILPLVGTLSRAARHTRVVCARCECPKRRARSRPRRARPQAPRPPSLNE